MYQRHLTFGNAKYFTGDPIPFVAAAAKYGEDKPTLRSAYKGKQATVVHPKEVAAAHEGLFSKTVFVTAPYDDSTGLVKAYPLDSRKLGFYSRAPPARDQYTRSLEVERYREAIDREFRHIDRRLAETATSLSGNLAGTSRSTDDIAPSATSAPSPVRGAVASGTSSRTYAPRGAGAGSAAGASGGGGGSGSGAGAGATASETDAAASRVFGGRPGSVDDTVIRSSRPRFMYDYVHTDLTRPDWQRTSRDVWYHRKLCDPSQPRNLGSLSTSTNDYGAGITSDILRAPEHGKVLAWKDFYDRGHIDGSGGVTAAATSAHT